MTRNNNFILERQMSKKISRFYFTHTSFKMNEFFILIVSQNDCPIE